MRANHRDYEVMLTNSMILVYAYMFLGLLITGVFAYWTYTSRSLMEFILGSRGVFYLLIFGELAMIIALSHAVRRMSFSACFLFFILYAVLNGLTMSVIFLTYTSSSIYTTFLVAALTFGAMSAVGYLTKKDLTSVGHYCLMGLIGIIVAGIVNLFIMNDTASFVITAIGLVVFIGLTAYDTQKIKSWLQEDMDPESMNKVAIWGALTLYLDFINIFLEILSLKGRRKGGR